MPKDREKAINPAAAQRKAEKQKALKKGKAAIAAQRTERLAKQNPNRIQSQIDDLKALESSSGALNARDKKQLEELERDLSRVKKAKDAVGDKYERRPRDGNDSRRGGLLGKRSRDDRGGHGRDQGRRSWDTRAQKDEPESSETDESVRNIPMPRDTPPPIPRPWKDRHRDSNVGTNANNTPLGERRPHGLPDKPSAPAPAQTIYESKPVMRDLRKEATAFVPAAVKRNLGQGPGTKKEEAVYGDAVDDRADTTKASGDVDDGGGKVDTVDDFNEDMKRLQEEEEKWRRETRQAHVEEVDDEEA